jgi:hypothetical protein
LVEEPDAPIHHPSLGGDQSSLLKLETVHFSSFANSHCVGITFFKAKNGQARYPPYSPC